MWGLHSAVAFASFKCLCDRSFMCFCGLKASLLFSFFGITLGSCPSCDPPCSLGKQQGGFILFSFFHSSSTVFFFPIRSYVYQSSIWFSPPPLFCFTLFSLITTSVYFPVFHFAPASFLLFNLTSSTPCLCPLYSLVLTPVSRFVSPRTFQFVLLSLNFLQGSVVTSVQSRLWLH